MTIDGQGIHLSKFALCNEQSTCVMVASKSPEGKGSVDLPRQQ